MKDENDSVNQESRRRESRRLFNQDATLQIIECSEADFIGESIEARIIDVSMSGFRLSTTTPLEECTVGLWVDLSDESESFFLAAAVRWAVFESDQTYQIGLELIGHPLAEIERWLGLWTSISGEAIAPEQV